MANIHIAKRFSALENVKSILWPASIRYNFVRYCCCALLFATMVSIASANDRAGNSAAGAFATAAIGFFLMTLLLIVPLSVVTGWVARVFPPAGLFCLFLSLFTSIGDPILWFLSLLIGKMGWYQWLVPLETPPFFSLSPFVYVLRPEESNEVHYAGEIPVQNAADQGFDPRRG